MKQTVLGTFRALALSRKSNLNLTDTGFKSRPGHRHIGGYTQSQQENAGPEA